MLAMMKEQFSNNPSESRGPELDFFMRAIDIDWDLAPKVQTQLRSSAHNFIGIIHYIQEAQSGLEQNDTSQEQAFRFLAEHLNSVLSFYKMVANSDSTSNDLPSS